MQTPAALRSTAATTGVQAQWPGAGVNFDAFLSYASAQRSCARSIQRYLQSQVTEGVGRMVVYLDETDIRGGDLRTELGLALDRARQLIVCCSPEAADSRWVGDEIARFLRTHSRNDVVLAWVAGPLERAVPRELNARELRVHDVRRWWFGRWPWPRTGLELARMYARLANAPLRLVVDWERRRTSARTANVVFATVTLVVALAGAVVYQARTAEASENLDQLSVDKTQYEAIRAARVASPSVKRRAISIVVGQPARAAVAVRTGWPVAVIGLDPDLATALLPSLRAALVTEEGSVIPAPRLANYRYALGMLRDPQGIRGEAKALLKDVLDARTVEGHPDGVYWMHARRSALLVGYMDLLEVMDNPSSELPTLRKLIDSLEDGADLEGWLDPIESILRKRGVSFTSLRHAEAPDQAEPDRGALPQRSMGDPIETLGHLRSAVSSASKPQEVAKAYAVSVLALHDPKLLEAEFQAIEALLTEAPSSPLVPELLKMEASIAVQRDDVEVTRRVALRLTGILSPPPPRPIVPSMRGAGFVNFPAPLDDLPSKMLESGEPRALVHFVASYAQSAKPGLVWKDLHAASKNWREVAAASLGSKRLLDLIRAERENLDQSLYEPWWNQIATNCSEWLSLVTEPGDLVKELAVLARQILADPAGPRATQLLKIYAAAGTRLWVDLHYRPDREAVAQVLSLLPHPMWSERMEFLETVVPAWAPNTGRGVASFVGWSRKTYALQLTLSPP